MQVFKSFKAFKINFIKLTLNFIYLSTSSAFIISSYSKNELASKDKSINKENPQKKESKKQETPDNEKDLEEKIGKTEVKTADTVVPPFFNFENEFVIPVIKNTTTIAYINLKIGLEATDLEKCKIVEKNHYRLSTVLFETLFNAFSVNWDGASDPPLTSIKQLLKRASDDYLGENVVKEILISQYFVKKITG